MRWLLLVAVFSVGCATTAPVKNTWVIPLSTPDQDRLCVQQFEAAEKMACIDVGQLRLMLHHLMQANY